MSSNAVKILFDTAKSVNLYDKLVLAVANTSVVAVGPKTKKILGGSGIPCQTSTQYLFFCGYRGDTN